MTILDTALHDSLRALKLSGMLHTLDARLAQAQWRFFRVFLLVGVSAGAG